MAKARTLLSDGATSADVVDGLYESLGGVDGLIDAIGDLEEALAAEGLTDAARAELAAMLETLTAARDSLDAWLEPEEGGPLGLLAGFDELIQQADIDEAAQELIDDTIATARERWAEAMSSTREALAPAAALAAEAASTLESSQDPGGLTALASVESMVALLLEDMPQSIHDLLEGDASKIHINASMIDSVLIGLGSLRAVQPSTFVQLTDERLGLGLGALLSGVLDQLISIFQSLRARIS